MKENKDQKIKGPAKTRIHFWSEKKKIRPSKKKKKENFQQYLNRIRTKKKISLYTTLLKELHSNEKWPII